MEENLKSADFAHSYAKNNFRAILDLDFDYHDKINDHRLKYLEVYSIENYYFNRIVLSYILANILKSNMKDVLISAKYYRMAYPH